MYGVINPVARWASKRMPTVRPVLFGDFMESCTERMGEEFREAEGSRQKAGVKGESAACEAGDSIKPGA
jgi:hypothetical protein